MNKNRGIEGRIRIKIAEILGWSQQRTYTKKLGRTSKTFFNHKIVVTAQLSRNKKRIDQILAFILQVQQEERERIKRLLKKMLNDNKYWETYETREPEFLVGAFERDLKAKLSEGEK
jgi:hypothetical protein